MALKSLLKNSGLALLGRVTRRCVVMLPQEARSESEIFDLRAPYSADDPLRIELRETIPGSITATLLEYKGHFPTGRLWESSPFKYAGPCDFVFSLSDGMVHIAGHSWGKAPVPRSRRFCWLFTLSSEDNLKRSRMTGHYFKVSNRVNDAQYFQGDNYVNHKLQSIGEHARVIELMRQHGANDPVLEIGCATGGLLEELDKKRIQSYGLDISEWAVEKAQEKLGPDRVWLCDAEAKSYPEALLRHGPFGTLVLWAVFEHFRNPFGVLENLTRFVRLGSTLLINTTNANSLCHTIFGPEWEGFFDWTHLGVEHVRVATIERELPRIGWRIAYLATHQAWDGNADPTHATLREWWAVDARFRRLLVEHDLGDLITCVAVKK